MYGDPCNSHGIGMHDHSITRQTYFIFSFINEKPLRKLDTLISDQKILQSHYFFSSITGIVNQNSHPRFPS